MPTRLVAPSASSAANASDEGSSSFRSETTYGSREATSARKGSLSGSGRSYPTRGEAGAPARPARANERAKRLAGGERPLVSDEGRAGVALAPVHENRA